jgi:GT2 family glycosyltransferase
MGKSVSVVIATYNREDVLCETIEQFKRQNYDDYTVHIVDHTIKHDTSTQNYLDSLPRQFRHYNLSEGGLCTARNFGLEQSDSDIIVYVDDDVNVERDFLSNHVHEYENPKVGAVAGQVLTPRHPEPINKPPIGKITWYGRSISRLHSSQPGYVKEGRGCNMSFRTEVLNTVGGFDTNLEFRDESDIFSQIKKKGYLIRFSPDAGLYHKENEMGGTIFSEQASPSEIIQVSKNKHYYHLKNKPLITFPLAVLTSILYQFKTREKIHKIPYDISLIFKGTYAGFLLWLGLVTSDQQSEKKL